MSLAFTQEDFLVYHFLSSRLDDNDDCTPGICQNGGTCYDNIDNYFCACALGFMGRNCQISEYRRILIIKQYLLSTLNSTTFIFSEHFGYLKFFQKPQYRKLPVP